MSKKVPEGPWDEIGGIINLAMRATGCDFGVIFLRRNGAVASIAAGLEESADAQEVAKALRLFRDRINDMIRHAEKGELKCGEENNTFIRDAKTGEYEVVEGSPDQLEKKCPLCGGSGWSSVGHPCICTIQ